MKRKNLGQVDSYIYISPEVKIQIFSFSDVLVKCVTGKAFNLSNSNNQTVKKRPSIFIAIHQQQVTTSLMCINAT